MIDHFISRRRSRPDFGIDLGTANTRLVVRGEGVVFEEPSLCSYSELDGQIRFVAAGNAARNMQDRVPVGQKIREPLARGVLQDLDAASNLLSHALKTVSGKRYFTRPSALIGIPADATKAEASALHTAANDAGFGKVDLVREPFAAAIGADLPIGMAQASMIIECGAGTTEIAVFSLNGVCTTRSVRGGGAALNAGLADFIHKKHHFLIGRQSAERLKRELAHLYDYPGSAAGEVTVKGRDMRARLPGTLTLPVAELKPVFTKYASFLAEAARQALNDITPDLAADLLNARIIATGGSAVVGFVARAIERETGIAVEVAAGEAGCVARGLEALLDG